MTIELQSGDGVAGDTGLRDAVEAVHRATYLPTRPVWVISVLSVESTAVMKRAAAS